MASNAMWMERAFKNAGKPGHSLHKTLGVPAGQKIPAGKLRAAEDSPNGHTRKMAQAAANAKGARTRKPFGQKA